MRMLQTHRHASKNDSLILGMSVGKRRALEVCIDPSRKEEGESPR